MEDLQGLLERINREGVEKANAESARIVAEARAKASEIVKEAETAAARAKAAAEKAAADYQARAAETVKQAARDVVLGVRESVTALLENLLAKDVDAALSDEKTVMALVSTAIQDLTGPGEIVAGAKLASALKAQASALGDFTLVTDETLGTGFSVRLDAGRVEHAYTGEVIAAELAKRLRPDLAALLK
ncbi:MAG: hypothetical protein SPK75_06025 [Victivallales bacterium]|nr:hypothetical protein [Victivallales bacterium]